MKLRPYQQQAVDRIHEELAEHQSTLLVSATGCGKTIVFAHVACDYLERGKVMVLAHRQELIYQAHEKLHAVCDIGPDIEMADYHSSVDPRKQADIIVSSIQTQIAGRGDVRRMSKFDPDDFSLVIVDEAHHTTADSYIKVLDYYKQNPDLKILGVTATPDRADEKALGQVYESVAFEYEILDAINDGWLVPLDVNIKHLEDFDLSWIKTTAGDLNLGQLAEEVERERTLHAMAMHIIEECGDTTCLIFTVSVKQAELLSGILNGHKPGSAEWVEARTDKDVRKDMFARYKAKEFQYLVNVGVATEGFDEPGIGIIVLARPTKSRSLYAQMIGRGTRPLPGLVDGLELASERQEVIAQSQKASLSILDFAGNSGHHRLVTPADVLGGKMSDEAIERANRMLAQGQRNVASALVAAERAIASEQHRRLAQRLAHISKATARYSNEPIDPFEVFGVTPCRERGWTAGSAPTQKQLDLLAKFRVDTDGLTKQRASQLIDQCIKRRHEGLCTYRQALVLMRSGYDPDGVTFKEASEIISDLAANNWGRRRRRG